MLAQGVDPFGAVPMITHFTRHQYQGHHQNWSIAAGKDGWIYAGNGNGLLVFDGSRWRQFSLPRGQVVRSVAVDDAGRVFTGGYTAFGYWEKDKEAGFKYHPLPEAPDNTAHSPEEIWHIHVRKNEVWLQSFSMLFRYDYQQVKSMLPPGNLMFVEEIKGRLVFQQIGSGLVEIDFQRNFRQLPGTSSLADKTVKAILPLTDDEWLIGTEQNGLWVYQHRTGLLLPWQNDAAKILLEGRINRGVRLSNGLIALGTILQGVVILNEAGRLIWHLQEENGLQNNTVLSMAEDLQGNLWLGLDKGIDRVAIPAPLTVFYDVRGKMGVVYAAAVFLGKLFVGTNRGIFFRTKGSEAGQDFQLVPGSQGQVWEMRATPEGLICGHNEGTFLITPDGNLTQISTITGGWVTREVPGHPDLLLQGTYTGLVMHVRERNTWKFGYRIAGYSDPTREMEFDSQGRLWCISPYKGLMAIDLHPDMKRVQKVQTFNLKESSGLADRLRFSGRDADLRVMSGGQSWTTAALTLDSSLVLREVQGQKVVPTIAFRDGSSFELLEGSLLYQKEKRSWPIPLTLIPGFEHVLLLDSVHFLMCLEEGFAIFDQAAFSQWFPGSHRPVLLNYLAIHGNTEKTFWLDSPAPDPMQLPAGVVEITIGFSVPGSWGQKQFQYRLMPHDTTWIDNGTEQEARFLNLRPGKYRFEVRTAENQATSSFSFEMAPHWFETPVAYGGFVVLIVALFLLLMRFNRWWLRQQRVSMEAEQERSLQEQVFKTTNERLQLDVMSKGQELAHSTMHLVQKNEMLIKIKRELSKLQHAGNSDSKAFTRIVNLIDESLTAEKEWEAFENNFNEIHDQFFKKLLADVPDLTPGDLRLAALLRLNLSSKEIAPLLSISIRGIENKRYRLRKKLNLDQDANLIDYLMRY